MNTFQKYRIALINLLGNEENVRFEWNKYVVENKDAELTSKVYLNNAENLSEYILPFMENDAIAESIFSKGYNAFDKYVYKVGDKFKSCNTIFCYIDSVSLYEYVIKKRMEVVADMFEWAKELKTGYDSATNADELLSFANSSSIFLDRFIEVVDGVKL